jgi:RimJ/RimL family protein N-acetyltransferase
MRPSIADLDWPVRTDRLSILPATVDDVDATWAYRRLEEVARWMTAWPAERDEYAERFTDEGRLAKTLVIEKDGLVIGDLMVAVEDAWAQAEVREQAAGVQAEIGWCLDPAYGGRGYGTEAVAALLGICFDGLGLRRVFANCFADNTASWRLMERLGMRREQHTVKDSLHRSGRWLDGMLYALLAEEWRART